MIMIFLCFLTEVKRMNQILNVIISLVIVHINVNGNCSGKFN